MMDFRSFESNPWKEEEERRYGSTRRLMSLARDLGYKFDTPDDAAHQMKAVQSHDSIRMLSLMSEISATEEELNSLNRAINRNLLDKETHDITNLTVIESRLSKLAALSTHLGDVVDKKSTITSCLQKPYSRENLLIDASLQKYVVEFFTMISPLLSDLSNLLDTISWTTTNAKDFPNKTDRVLIRMNGAFNAVNEQVERLAKLRSTIDSLSSSTS
ncbi:uncharacterized protein [Watersipora subatra]|uniref:uncharacterized protein n=1 Tax=Watersipora subatra TaxID=2589382 RepID=UPI00355B60F4